MTELILQWLKELGLAGLFTSMFLEGSSLPFPGIAVVIAYGYVLPPKNTIWIAAVMSFVYCIASLIPYFLGRKVGWLLKRKQSKGLQKANELFLHYGYWSVAVTRPFGLGNYISYIAGMAKIRLRKYLLLTFVGIYPWSFGMLLLGKYFDGSHKAFRSFYHAYGNYLLPAVAMMAITALVLVLFFTRHRTRVRAGIKEGRDSA